MNEDALGYLRSALRSSLSGLVVGARRLGLGFWLLRIEFRVHNNNLWLQGPLDVFLDQRVDEAGDGRARHLGGINLQRGPSRVEVAQAIAAVVFG